MIRRPPRSTLSSSSAASDVYKRQVRGSDVLVAVLDRDLEFELDGRTLSPKDDYVRALVAGDVSRRLGLTTGPFSVEGLGATIVDVIAASKRRPVYRDNLRDLG